jgi:Tol biopolymer transport system component
VLAWQSRGSFKTRLAWIDRQGRPIGNLAIQPDRWFRLIMSPDGSRAVLRKDEENGSSLWLLDLERESVSRLTSGPDAEDPGVWSPDGKEILYSLRGPGGVCDVRRMTVDQPETDRSFYRSSGFLQNAYGWSPDGRWVLIQDMRKESDFDLVLVSARDGATRPYLATPSAERRAVISPDGQWVLYLTNESGVPQACVRSFSAPAVERVVSPVPLFAALWSKHGREILLMGRDFRLRSVAVEGGKTLRLGTPQELFALPSDIRGLAPTPDGERFLILEPELRTSPEPAIEVSVNWMAGLQP